MKKTLYIFGLVTVLLSSAFQAHAIDLSSPNTSNYPLLEPVPDTQNQGGGNAPTAVQYLQRIYYLALVAAVILAILMLVIAGAEYTAAGVSPSAKEDAKKRIMYALGGLLLALLSWLILNTINPGILKSDIGISKIPGSSNDSGSGGGGAGSGGGGAKPYGALINTDAFADNPRPACQKIADAAEMFLNNHIDTSCISGTGGGNLACAAVVNAIVATATGEEVGGGLSTQQMQEAITKNGNFYLVENGTPQPGDIWLAPTGEQGLVRGHVGIYSYDDTVISNSSSQHTVGEQSIDYWLNRYQKIYVYRSTECKDIAEVPNDPESPGWITLETES